MFLPLNLPISLDSSFNTTSIVTYNPSKMICGKPSLYNVHNLFLTFQKYCCWCRRRRRRLIQNHKIITSGTKEAFSWHPKQMTFQGTVCNVPHPWLIMRMSVVKCTYKFQAEANIFVPTDWFTKKDDFYQNALWFEHFHL